NRSGATRGSPTGRRADNRNAAMSAPTAADRPTSHAGVAPACGSGQERTARQDAIGARAGLAAMLLAVVAGWLLWASAVPFGEAPDEPSHLEVAQFVATHGRLPTFGPDGDMYVRLDQVGIPIESHALAPPLTYLVDAALIRMVPVAP